MNCALIIKLSPAILATYGLTCPCDPRWIAAAHAYAFRDAEPTIRTVMAACRLCSKRTHEDNEILARSYGI
jgi:hypothetical protein